MSFAISASPRFAPGTAYEYSNTNTVLLGMIVEQVTRMTMAQALRGADLFGRSRLRNTSYPYYRAAAGRRIPRPTTWTSSRA